MIPIVTNERRSLHARRFLGLIPFETVKSKTWERRDFHAWSHLDLILIRRTSKVGPRTPGLWFGVRIQHTLVNFAVTFGDPPAFKPSYGRIGPPGWPVRVAMPYDGREVAGVQPMLVVAISETAALLGVETA